MAKSSARKRQDRVIAILWGAIFVVFLVAATGVLYLVASGLMTQHAPRTVAERQIQYAEAHIKTDAGSATAWTDLIDGYTYTKQFDDAEDAYKQAIRSLPSSVSAAPVHVAYARALYTNKQSDEALKVIEKALKEAEKWRERYLTELKDKGVKMDSPNAERTGEGPMIDALIIRAQIHRDRKEWQKVVDTLDQTIEMAPIAADHLTLRGIAYVELGEVEKARADFNTALEYGFEPAAAELKKLEN